MKIAAFLLLFAVSAFGQSPAARRGRPAVGPLTAETAVKQAADQLAAEKKVFERDLAVLRRLRTADQALTDPMQPSNAVQKAYEEVDAAKGLSNDFLVTQGIVKLHGELESARRSPMSADFGRLRALLHDHALGPATRLVLRNAVRLEEETLAWIKVQEVIAAHLRSLSEIAAESLRVSQ